MASKPEKTITINLSEYNALKECEKQYNKLRELVNRFVDSTNLLPSGANPAPVKAKKLTNKIIIERFDEHFERRQSKIKNKR